MPRFNLNLLKLPMSSGAGERIKIYCGANWREFFRRGFADCDQVRAELTWTARVDRILRGKELCEKSMKTEKLNVTFTPETVDAWTCDNFAFFLFWAEISAGTKRHRLVTFFSAICFKDFNLFCDWHKVHLFLKIGNLNSLRHSKHLIFRRWYIVGRIFSLKLKNDGERTYWLSEV